MRLLAKRAGTTRDLHLVATGTTAADGSVSFTDTPHASLVYRLRLVAGTGYPGAVSERAVVVVRTPRRCRSADAAPPPTSWSVGPCSAAAARSRTSR